ncbi:SGNH/GDSL hydrolase family protein [Chitinophaga nivalis]|uniref:SGNH/GDSL hydrolase family protein n=1 Tax=Chitinophaga nivalis TaxID=2991709 RepID=A0ABT3ILD3_9BACT|nr:SGNH/GDSL hydrolase family protein [Chitinophaga nivalis]MCW3465523.1 SGNH/GDSL hydrolase family protein [Chitinophaga nivalis]MCW3484786.1 SGNH/GDSL hydrolase family protein [Chitinophaga nivalis]
MNSSNRRNFLKQLSLGGVAVLSIPDIVSAAVKAEKPKKVTMKKGAVILFQGDSITDAGRKRDNFAVNNGNALGGGYPLLAASSLLLKHPDKNLQCYNKGISGNKVFQLADRWEADCLSLKPDILSILIGVNDYWHTLSGNYKGTLQTYRDDYDKLLTRTREQLPDVQLIIGEPFAVSGVKVVDDKWYPLFNEYRAAAKELATKHNAVFIPYQAVFDKAITAAPGIYWTGDGVHPTIAGAQLMAEAWMQCVK